MHSEKYSERYSVFSPQIGDIVIADLKQFLQKNDPVVSAEFIGCTSVYQRDDHVLRISAKEINHRYDLIYVVVMSDENIEIHATAYSPIDEIPEPSDRPRVALQ